MIVEVKTDTRTPFCLQGLNVLTLVVELIVHKGLHSVLFVRTQRDTTLRIKLLQRMNLNEFTHTAIYGQRLVHIDAHAFVLIDVLRVHHRTTKILLFPR